jgi:hypothetical protein
VEKRKKKPEKKRSDKDTDQKRKPGKPGFLPWLF